MGSGVSGLSPQGPVSYLPMSLLRSNDAVDLFHRSLLLLHGDHQIDFLLRRDDCRLPDVDRVLALRVVRSGRGGGRLQVSGRRLQLVLERSGSRCEWCG